jgi:hypothetical protein
MSGCLKKENLSDNTLAGGINATNMQMPSVETVVVAILDGGINPYHEVFRRPNNTQPPWTYIPGFPKDAIALNLTFNGTYWENIEADKDTWAKVEKGKIYWIPHTCIVGAISFGFDGNTATALVATQDHLILDYNGHGTGASACVIESNPDASIVMVQSSYMELNTSLRWAINQSWTDIISHDYGNNLMPGVPADPEWYDVPKISELGWKVGKILITAAGNRPVPMIGQAEAGPPAFIVISAGNEEAKGEIAIASKVPDFISKWTHRCPTFDSTCGYKTNGATSWAAPYTAGIFSKVLLEARITLNCTKYMNCSALIKVPEKNITITNADVRNAFNKTAVYWTPLDYDATKNQVNVNTSDPLVLASGLIDTALSVSIPVAPAAPFLQMGWGYIGPEIVNDTVDILLGKKQYQPTPEKQLAEPYMNAIYELRKQFWDNWPLEN